MQDISFYLKKFENIGLRESTIKKTIIEVVGELTGIELTKDDLDFNRDQIRINKTGTEKTEIFINKSRIEKILNERLNESFGDREIKTNKKIL